MIQEILLQVFVSQIIMLKKSYKPIELSSDHLKIIVTLQEDIMAIQLIQQQARRYVTCLHKDSFDLHLKKIFITFQNIYWYFSCLGEHEVSELITVVHGNLHLKVRQVIAGIQIYKYITLELQKAESLDKTKEENITISEEGPGGSQKQVSKFKLYEKRLAQLQNKITSLSKTINSHSSPTEYKHITEDIERKIKTLQSHNQLLVTRLLSLEEKIALASEENKNIKEQNSQNIQEIMKKVNQIRHNEENTRKTLEILIKKRKISSNTFFQQSILENRNREQEDLTESPEGPIDYFRIESQNNISSNDEESQLSQEHKILLAQITDFQMLQKKIQDLHYKFNIFIPPVQLKAPFKQSPFKNRYDIQKQNQYSTIYSKKNLDKKYQLTGNILPSCGNYYYKVRLVQVPHGYIHFGIVSDLNELEPSSYNSQNSINYFGGNGSVNDKSNGIYLGQPLKNGDIVTVLFNMDLKLIFFIMKGKLLGEANFKSIQKSKGLMPYVQLFYGGSKIEVINQ